MLQGDKANFLGRQHAERLPPELHLSDPADALLRVSSASNVEGLALERRLNTHTHS